jgi:hypothetical protein
MDGGDLGNARSPWRVSGFSDNQVSTLELTVTRIAYEDELGYTVVLY